MKINKPKNWREGQFIFNFLQWLHIAKNIDGNQNYRLADTFYISDKDFDKYYNEYIAIINYKE